MEFATAAIGDATKCALSHVQREISYLVHFRRNTNHLEQKLEQLKAMRNDVERKVDTARNKIELIREAVETWLKRVKIVEDETVQLINEARKINSWFKGWCCCSRFSLGRKAEKKIADIQSVLDERSTFGDTVSDPKPIQSMELVPMGDPEAFAFRETTMKQVLKALQDDKVIIVGVYGMGGVGKTTLVNALAIHVKRENIFNEVVMVTLSQNPDLKSIQGEVAKELDLELKEEDSVSIRARKLQERFRISNNILVILDNMWERLDLAEMGIPLGNDRKLLLTTRSQDVCNAMETQATIEVRVLLEEDSWRLFRQKAGDVINSLDDQKVARDIVNECKGLPLAIVTLGRALRNKEYGVWVSALAQIKNSIFDGMEPVVSSIKLSYSYLPGEREKLCFLFCCLFPEGSKIEMNVLLSYVIGERILRDVGTLEEAKGRLHYTIVDRLVSSCLLMRDKGGNVKIHDVVRDAAILIASEASNGFMVKANMSFAHWRDVKLDQCKRMSLTKSCSLPNQIKTPQLLTLSLRNVSDLEEIPSDFFQETKNLLNLDLSGTSIKTLPSSISYLVNLRTLQLRSCRRLENASPVEKLENLEILSLKDTPLPHFTGVGKLTNLRAFDFNFSSDDNILLPDISSLAQLEKLRLANIDPFRGKSLLYEVASLSRLGTLKLLISYTTSTIFESNMANILSWDIPNHWESLERFTIRFPNIPYSVVCAECGAVLVSQKGIYKRNMFLTINSSPVANWVTTLLGRAEYLNLLWCKGFESVVVHLDPRGMDRNLKFLSMSMCGDLKYLISTIGVEGPTHAFSCLEKLRLTHLFKFEAICHGGVLPQGFLHKLRVLEVDACDQLIVLLPSYLLVRLQNLESLTVYRCSNLEKLVQFEEEDNRLSLINNTPSGAASSSSSIGTISCQPEPSTFPNLGYINISDCHKLKCVLPVRVFRQLLQLKELHVSSCDHIEVIIEPETEENDKTILTLPQLSILEIVNLPKLSSFGRPGLLARWPLLECLKVHKCDSLSKLPLDSVSVPKLKKLDADSKWFDGLEWDDESRKPCLQALLPVKD